jgi:nicotinate-nucleotide pyrophosphorylase (carboxylating)
LARRVAERTVEAARAPGAGVSIQVEVGILDELEEALAAGAAAILLDNFSLKQMREAVSINQRRAELEVSGGVTSGTLLDIALRFQAREAVRSQP